MDYKNSNQVENKFKGTKGKWSLSKQNVCGRQMVDLGDFKGHIDVWHHNGDSMTAEEAKANAKLISKAPEMLEAMQWFCDRVDNGEVRSTKTYKKFKQIIKEATEI